MLNVRHCPVLQRHVGGGLLCGERGPARQGGDDACQSDAKSQPEAHGPGECEPDRGGWQLRGRCGSRLSIKLSRPMSPLVVLIVAVLATTYAGPIVRLAAAPAVAIAFWRLALVLPVTFGLAIRERQRTRPVREAFPLMLLSGLLLAVHFWTWIASLKFTSVASSVVLVSLKPVFAWSVAALWLREHPGRTERRGIALAVAGATLIGLGDARLSLGAAAGDALALAGALAAPWASGATPPSCTRSRRCASDSSRRCAPRPSPGSAAATGRCSARWRPGRC